MLSGKKSCFLAAMFSMNMTHSKIIGKSILNSTTSFVLIEIWGLFNGFQVLEQAALLTPALIGVRAIFKSGGIRAGVKGAGVKKGPAEKGPIRYNSSLGSGIMLECIYLI